MLCINNIYMENKIKEVGQETELDFLANKLKSFSSNVGRRVYNTVRFLLDNLLVLLVLIVVGFGLGYLIDSLKSETYLNEVILVTNFNSEDYLYSQVRHFDKAAFLKKDNAFSHVKSMKVEPVENLFTMMDGKGYRTFETFKLLVERGVSMGELRKDKTFLKNNKYHRLKIKVDDEKSSDKVVSIFIDYLNSNKYLQERGKVEIENTKRKIEYLKSSIVQIDSLLSNLSSGGIGKGKDFNINTYPDINKVINLKNGYADAIREGEISIIEYQKPIFVSSVNLNVLVLSLLTTFKLTIPVLFVLVFLFYKSFASFMRKYKE